jgi:hypothetical protein
LSVVCIVLCRGHSVTPGFFVKQIMPILHILCYSYYRITSYIMSHNISVIETASLKILIIIRSYIIYIVKKVQFIKPDNNQLSPWRRVILGRQIMTQLLTKFLIFCATRYFITVFTKARK